MKKLIFLLLALAIAFGSFGQFRDNVNISFFAGGYVAEKNANNNGGWYGMYAEYMPIKTPDGLNIGFCAVASQVSFKTESKTSIYKGSSTDFGAGLAAGKYVEVLTQSHSGYFGLNLMLKKSQDMGEGQAVGTNNVVGYYDAKQKDLMLSGELNLNFLKTFGFRENLFPRTQLRLTAQRPLNSEKTSFWNNSPIKESVMWNKSAYGVELKQSIVQIGRMNTLLETKVYSGYYHYQGDKSNWIAVGPELALKKRGWDDFLSIYALYKMQVGDFTSHANDRQFIIGLNFMPFNIR